jgi:small-conductance mechanosensitive channel
VIQALTTWASETFGLSPQTQLRLLATAAIIALLVGLRWAVLSAVHRRVPDLHLRYRWHKGATYVVVVLGLVLAARVWLVEFAGLATYLGLLSAGLAIALKDPLANLAGWLFILWRRPLEVGDRVQLGTHSGDVVDVRLFQFTLLEIGNWVAADQTTGRLIHIPNALVFTAPLANYTRGFRFIWTELPILVTFESDWEKAKSLLEEISERHGRSGAGDPGLASGTAAVRYALPKSPTTPAVYVSVEASGVLLTLRVRCSPRERRKTTDVLWQEVLRAFAGCTDVDFAYPTTRLYANDREGKPGKHPPGVPGAPPSAP